jgi:hypothetical protein
VPGLVVLVRSPSDPWLDRFRQMVEELRAGVRVVVLIDLKFAAACVYRDDDPPRVMRGLEELTLPGFAVRIDRLLS